MYRSISLIIPAYNEEKRIEETLRTYNDALNHIYNTYEIIVVCDGCTDNTINIVENYAKKNLHIKLLKFPERLGKGGALIVGFCEAVNEIIGFVDADCAIMFQDYEKLINAVELNADCAIGIRYGTGAKIITKQNLIRCLSSRIFNIIVRIIFRINLQDTQCGAKVFKSKVIKTILPYLKTTNFAFDVDILWNIKKNNFQIVEIPISWSHKEFSKFTLRSAPNMFISLLKIRF